MELFFKITWTGHLKFKVVRVAYYKLGHVSKRSVLLFCGHIKQLNEPISYILPLETYYTCPICKNLGFKLK